MSPRPPLSLLALALAACALSERPAPGTSAPPPGAPSPDTPPRLAPPPLFARTSPAPAGAALRVFVDPAQLVGWIAGSASYEGRAAQIEVAGVRREVDVGADNTFAVPYRVVKPTEATIRVGALVQRVTLEPPAALEPTVFFVVDRTAYRPGQQLAFAGFLKRLDGGGAFQPIAGGTVEVRLVSETRKTVAAKLAVTADADGRIAGAYTFSPADPLDDYTLSIPGHRGTARVTLAEFRKSKVKLEVEATVAGRDATLQFRALDFLDQPIPGGVVQFTAQVVRDDASPRPAGALASEDFAYGPPPRTLDGDDALRYAADPDTAGPTARGRRVVVERKDQVALGAGGTGTHALALRSEWLRGHHSLLVDATIVDANGREQRAVRSLPLERRDVRVELSAPHELAAAGEPVDVTVRVVDAQGRPVAAAATVVATRLAPAAQPYAYGGLWNNGWNGNAWNDDGWNGNAWNDLALNVPRCTYTAAGCRPWRRLRGARPLAAADPDPVAAAAAATHGVARLVLDEPGAYRLLAVGRLPDGSSVWSELGVAVRDRDELPPLVLELDRDEVRQGETLTARLHGRYDGARALVVARDAAGIKVRRTVALAGGAASIALPIPAELGHGAAIDAYLLGEGGEVLAAQRPVRVIPALRTLAITTSAKPTYGPGDTVDLEIDAGRPEAIDLVVSVYDQALLGIAPDRGPDPSGFYWGDQRLRGRAALPLVRARLGDLTIGDLLAKAHRLFDAPRADASADPASPVFDPERADAALVVQTLEHGGVLDLRALLALLRHAGLRAAASAPYSGWQVPLDDARRGLLRRTRLADFLETFARALTFEAVADAIVVGDPALATTGLAFVPIRGAARGDSHFSVTGNASFSAPALSGGPAPAPIDPTAAGTGAADVVRRDFSDSAYWSGHARTGADGRARVRFELPDSLTNWQVVVTAVSRDLRVGRHVARLRTVRDVMVWPMIPRQFTEGDTVSVFGTVHNLTDADRDIAVSIRAANADVLSPPEVTVRVPHGRSVPVTWSVRAREPGLATLLMSAAAPGAAADASEKRIPVVPAAAEQVVTASGFTDRPLVVELPPGVDPRSASLELTLAPSLAADVVQTLDYLVEYPYGCAEQTMSRFVPAIRVAGVLANLGIRDGALARRLPGVVAGGFKRLAELQQPDGGWGWQTGGQTHEMMTPYVVWGLLEARRAGHALPDASMLERGLARLRTFVAQLGEAQLSDRTYLLYVLAQHERLSAAHWEFLVAHRAQMSDYALALALEMAVARGDRAHADRVAADLRARARRAGGHAHWQTAGFSRWMEDPFEVTAAVLKALVAYDPGDPLVADVVAYFVASKRGDRWNSTKDTAMVLYALTELLAKQGVSGTGGAAASVTYAVDGGAPVRLSFADGLVRRVVVPGAQLRPRTSIAFPSSTAGMMARAVLRYRRSGRDLSPAANGLEVVRTLHLLDAAGKVVRPLRTGDRVPRGAYVESLVTVTHAANERMRYLLVEDPKPAGAETLPQDDPRFPRFSATWSLREDREQQLAYHHEETGPSTTVRSIMHLELAGDLALPPAHAELMYQTQTRGHSGTVVLRVD